VAFGLPGSEFPRPMTCKLVAALLTAAGEAIGKRTVGPSPGSA
jgi:hypothetical protein